MDPILERPTRRTLEWRHGRHGIVDSAPGAGMGASSAESLEPAGAE